MITRLKLKQENKQPNSFEPINKYICVLSKQWATDNFSIVPQNYDASQENFASSNAMGTGPFEITLREAKH